MTTRLRVILVALAVVAGVMLWPATANAATFSGRVSGTGGQGLFVRPGPSRGSGAPMYTLAEGAGVNFDCYVRGEVIAGYWYTGDIWHHLTSGGWVTDTYIYTGYNGPVPGEPVCGTATPVPPPTTPQPPPSSTSSYVCNARYVKGIRVVRSGGNVVIHVNPTTYGRWATRLNTAAGWKEVQACGARASSASLRSQFDCHAFGSAGLFGYYFGGAEWDLEGWRSPTWNWRTWVSKRCNW
jgi:hypothetical protein